VPEPLSALPHHDVIFRPPAKPITADLFLAFRSKFDGPVKRSLLRALSEK